MRTTPLLLSILTATLISAGAISAQAAEGKFYDPSNAVSPTGKTIGYELNRTIGCPGQPLTGSPCEEPKEADTDGDGVVDSKDKCPNTPAGSKVNADGCELDRDGDGVVDSKDKCPNTPAGRKVNADGCELDRDSDGIVDGNDKCPDVHAKTADGCPLPVAKPAEAIPRRLVLEGVNFDDNKAVLRPGEIAIIDQNAADLKEWGDIDVEVSGHTDNRGSDKHNMGLSQRRAEAVRTHLISKGISADRLTAKGYGKSQPIESNDTDEGRFKNRRVELNQKQKQ